MSETRNKTHQPDANFEAKYERAIKAIRPMERARLGDKSLDCGMDELAEELNRYLERMEIDHGFGKKVRR